MSTSYSPLATIDFGHTYYSSGKCPDLRVVAGADTEEVFRRQKIRYKQMGENGASSLRLHYSAKSDGTPLVALPGEFVWDFYLYLTKESFENFTDLPDRAPGQVLYFRNDDASLEMLPALMANIEVMDLKKEKFSYTIEEGGGTFPSTPTTLTVEVYRTNADGSETHETDYDADLDFDGTDTYTGDVDLSGLPEGKYVLKPTTVGFDAWNAAVYMKKEHWGIAPFAVMSLCRDTSEPAELDWDPGEAPFTVSFEADKRVWKYWIIKTDPSPSSIADSESPPNYFFEEKTPQAGDEENVQKYLVDYYGVTTADVKLYVSVISAGSSTEVALSYSENPVSGIQLLDEDGLDGQGATIDLPVIDHLPNPDPSTPRPEVFVVWETQALIKDEDAPAS